VPGSVFDDLNQESYPFRYEVELSLANLVGGVPSDPKVAEGWIRNKLGDTEDDARIQEMVAETMATRNITKAEAVAEVNNFKNLNGFKRFSDGTLYIEGRQVKAMLKEAVSIAVAAKKLTMIGWGETRKWLTKYFPEHVFVTNVAIGLYEVNENDELVAVKEPTGIHQQFVHTHRGSAIQYQEYVNDPVIKFTLISDHPFTRKDWGMILTTAEQNGLGASRSQGYGTFQVTGWVDKSTGFAAVEGSSNAAPRKAVKKTKKSAVDALADGDE
jgi:hypothetical protein